MVNVGFIVEGQSEAIVYKSIEFIRLLEKFGINLIKTVTPGGRPNFFIKEKIEKYCKELFDEGAEKIIIVIDKETDDECLYEIKKNIYNCDPENQINIIQVKTLESWFLADSVALSKAFKKKFHYPNPEKIEGHPFDALQNAFETNINRGLGPKESIRPAIKMVNYYGFSIENAANHDHCPSVKYFLQKLSELNPN